MGQRQSKEQEEADPNAVMCPINDRHTSTLPIELIGEIIRYLREDKPALKACCLTSRSWLPCARALLYNTANIECEEDLTRWTSLVQSCSDIRSRYLRRIKLHTGTSSDVIIRGLALGYSSLHAASRLEWDEYWIEHNAILEKLVPFAECLDVVEDLDLSAAFPCPHSLVKFLSFFQRLKKVRILHLIVPPECSCDDLNVEFSAASLEILDISRYGSVEMNTAVASWMQPHRLRSLHAVIDEQAMNIEDLADIISNSADTLQKLLIEPAFSATSLDQRVICRPLPNLRKIGFVIRDEAFSDRLGPPADNFRFTADFMEKMPVTSSVTDITLFLCSHVNQDETSGRSLFFESNEVWDDILFRCMKVTFPNVRIVDFRIWTDNDYEEDKFDAIARDLYDKMDELNLQALCFHVSCTNSQSGEAVDPLLLDDGEWD